MKWIGKVQAFMMGRYGADELYNFLLKLYVVLFIVNLFFKSLVLDLVGILVVVAMFYRFFSKKIYVRRKENERYLKIRKKVLKPFFNMKRNFKDRDYHVYKKCSKCKSTLKLPIPHKRGIQHARCPKCGKKIKFLCLRQVKVEVIKKK